MVFVIDAQVAGVSGDMLLCSLVNIGANKSKIIDGIRSAESLCKDVKVKKIDFVEVKKSFIGTGSKVNHLSYIGDSEIGEKVNVGAGTITCNYDGQYKHKTIIGDGAFIGSNTALVAPVKVGAGALIGAGSTITRDVPENNLGIARTRQKNLKRS